MDGLLMTPDKAEYRVFYDKNTGCTPKHIETRALVCALDALISTIESVKPSVLVLSLSPLVESGYENLTDIDPLVLSNQVSLCENVVFDTVYGSGVWRECRRHAYDCFEAKGVYPSVWVEVNATALVNSDGKYESYGNKMVDVCAPAPKRKYTSKKAVVVDDEASIASFFDQSKERRVLPKLHKSTRLQPKPQRAIDVLRCFEMPIASLSSEKLVQINDALMNAISKDTFTIEGAKELFGVYMKYWLLSEKYNNDMIAVLKLLSVVDLTSVPFVCEFLGNMDMGTVTAILARRTDIDIGAYVDTFRSIIDPGSFR
jgi:hypothetical protein